MYIEKLVVKNFKKFKDSEFLFNPETNIIVGDNDSGKSTLMEAIEICLNCTFHGRPLSGELTEEFFNNEAVDEFLKLDKDKRSSNKLPEILIEAYLKNAPSELRGTCNSLSENTEGLLVNIKLNPILENTYGILLTDEKIDSLPVEFYIIEWYDFADKKLNRFTKPIKNIFVEPDRIHPTFGKNKYINSILNESMDDATRSKLNFSYRQIMSKFDEDDDVISINNDLDKDQLITPKNLNITTDVNSNSTWDKNLQLAVDKVQFAHIGKGEQNQIQIKLSLHKKADSVNIVLIEEPENHLSHINLIQLIDYIEQYHGNKQLFITTHNSYVLNKLSIGNLCLIGEKFQRITDLDNDTINRIKRLPGYDTLRIVLAKKAILVEGPSDELIVKRLFKDEFDKLPEELGIDVIVVSGLGFKNYLNIAKIIGTHTLVIKDNDRDYDKKITKWFEEYDCFNNLKISSHSDNSVNTLEPALIDANSNSENSLDIFAAIILSANKKNEYDKKEDIPQKKSYLLEQFDLKLIGKVDSAIRIFQHENCINYPEYIREVLKLAK